MRVCPRLILCKAQHLVHETQLLPSSMLSRLHITSQCVRYCVCVCVCAHTYVRSLYVVCVAPPSSSPAVLGRRVWPGVHAVGVCEWLHCLPPLAPRCTGCGLLQALTDVSHTTCLSNVCGIHAHYRYNCTHMLQCITYIHHTVCLLYNTYSAYTRMYVHG